MSSIKKFLSDHETRVDLLNNRAIADTIVDLIRERPERPVTIGVHGDWGAGKSSILEMIEDSVTKQDGGKTVLCLKFNGWQFQGFEDAKIALIEGIVTGLIDAKPELDKTKTTVKEILKRINWLKVAKQSSSLAMTALTGIPSPDLLSSVISSAVRALEDPTKAIADTEKAIEDLKGILKPVEEATTIPEEIREFHKAFDNLLSEAKVDQLIVLIDDLDRCLPETTIHTLEAIRLFVFTPRTAFVVAADEGMVEYAVRRHFPELPDSTGPQSYARNYLEKLIQIPFRIPALGEGETKIYVSLALAEAMLGEDKEEFQKLLALAQEVLKRPWKGDELDDEKVRQALGENEKEIADLLVASDKIGPVLAAGTSGNPRQIKRFLNALVLRERIAEKRGFGDDIDIAALAKLMLAERFQPSFFDELVVESSANTEGRSALIKQLESERSGETSKEGHKKPAATKSSGTTKAPPKQESAWTDHPWIQDWLDIPPTLADRDLRPYAFVANQQARMTKGSKIGHLAPLIAKLMGSDLVVAGAAEEIKALNPAEALAVHQEIVHKIRLADLSKTPAGAEGIRHLSKTFPILQPETIKFLKTLPPNQLGPWAVNWESVLTEQKDDLREIIQNWSQVTSNKILSRAAAAILAGNKK